MQFLKLLQFHILFVVCVCFTFTWGLSKHFIFTDRWKFIFMRIYNVKKYTRFYAKWRTNQTSKNTATSTVYATCIKRRRNNVHKKSHENINLTTFRGLLVCFQACVWEHSFSYICIFILYIFSKNKYTYVCESISFPVFKS